MKASLRAVGGMRGQRTPCEGAQSVVDSALEEADRTVDFVVELVTGTRSRRACHPWPGRPAGARAGVDRRPARVERLELAESIGRARGLRASELARRLGWSRKVIGRHLPVLGKAGVLEKRGQRQAVYSLRGGIAGFLDRMRGRGRGSGGP